jgi:hypothetical protein
MEKSASGRKTVEWMLVVLSLLVVAMIGFQVAIWRLIHAPRELRARAFILTDASGSEIAKLQEGPTGPLLFLKRERQEVFIGALDSKEMGVAVTLDARAAAGLFSNVDGSKAITLYGRTASTAASLALNEDKPMVVLRSPQAIVGMMGVPDVYFRVAEGTHVLFQVPPSDQKAP